MGSGAPAAEQHQVAEPAAAPDGRLGDRRDVPEHRRRRRHLPAGERQPRPVRHVGGQAAAGRQHPGDLGVQLDRREVRRRPGAGEHVQHHQVGGAVPQPGQRLAGVGDLHRHPHAAWRAAASSRTSGGHLVRHLDRPLPRPWPGSGDVPGESQCAGPEMHDPQRRARLGNEIDDVAEPADVLEREVRRVVQVDVRLRRAVDGEQPARGAVGVGLDATTVATAALGRRDAGDPRVERDGVAQRPGDRLELRLDDVVGVAPGEHPHVQADLRARGERLPDVPGQRRVVAADQLDHRRARRARRRAGRTGRRRPAPASRPAGPARRRTGGCRPCRRAPRAAPGRARSRCPRRCGARRPRGRRVVRTVRSKPPCLPSWASMWSKNGTPVSTSVAPVAVEVELDQDLRLLGLALDLREPAHAATSSLVSVGIESLAQRVEERRRLGLGARR